MSFAKKCEHGKYKHDCCKCNPDLFCKHKKRLSECVECGVGKNICEHRKLRRECKECDAGEYGEDRRRKAEARKLAKQKECALIKKLLADD